MSNSWREIQNGPSDCKYWGISEKILRKEYFRSAVLRSKNAHFHLDLFYAIRLFEFPALIKSGFN